MEEQNETNEEGSEHPMLAKNKEAMDLLKINDFQGALRILKETEQSIKQGETNDMTVTLLGITYNNLGCYYKKRNKPNVALKYLEQALNIEMETEPDNINVAGTHLNLCAILSQVRKHGRALHHAKEALKLLLSG